MATFDGLRGVVKAEKGSRKTCGCRLVYVEGREGRAQPTVRCPGRGSVFVSRRDAELLAKSGDRNSFCVYLKPTKRGKPCSKAVRKAVKMWCGIDPG